MSAPARATPFAAASSVAAAAAVAAAVAAAAWALPGPGRAAAQSPPEASPVAVATAPAARPGAALGAAAGGASAQDSGAPPWPSEPPDAARGLERFGEHCAGCHGPLGRGDGALVDRLPAPPPDLASAARAASPADDFRTITDGRLERMMPPFGASLSDAERWDLVAAVRALRDTPHALVRGRVVWQARCAACHVAAVGDEGDADRPPGGSAAGRAAAGRLTRMELLGAFGEDGLEAIPTGDGEPGAAHGAALEGLAAGERADLLAYLRSLALQPLSTEGLVAGAAVRGRVVNRTPGGAPPSGGRIVLRSILGPVPEPPLTATLAEDGSYALEGIVGGEGAAYRAVIETGGARFAVPEPIAAMPDGGAGSERAIDVWDVAADLVPSALVLHTVAAPLAERGVLEVVERWVLAVEGDRAAGGVRVPLPGAARGVRLGDALAAEALVEPGAVVLPVALPPGEHEVVVVYEVPYAARSAVLDRPIVQPVLDASLTVLDGSARVASAAVAGSEPVTIGQASGIRYRLEPQPAGARLVLELEGLPPSAAGAQDVVGVRGPSPVSPGALEAVALGASVLGLVAALGFARRAPAGRRARLARARAALRAEAAELERARAAGNLAPNAYAARRARLVERALRLASDGEPSPGGDAPRAAPDDASGAGS